MEKQTAVEWLFEQLWETPKDRLTWHTILKKAKEMEKKQQEQITEESEIHWKSTLVITENK